MQLEVLRAYAAERNWTIAEEYVDEGVSGIKTSRPAFDRLMKDARKQKFNVLLVWKYDRFARSLVMLVNGLAELRELGIDFVSSTQQLDTTTAAGRAFFNMLATFAEFEREMIAERTAAGRKRYQDHWDAGKVGGDVHSKSGRDLAPHRPLKIFDRDAARRMRAEGRSLRAIGLELGVSAVTVLRLVAKDQPTALQKIDSSLPESDVANERLN
jgi:DNA invertase Pin-like site-specific DNA recombinase